MTTTNFNNCTTVKKISIITCTENGKTFRLLNPNRISIDYIKVDDCIYPKGINDWRCDYALNFKNVTIFVELKGGDIVHAIEQILTTKKDAKFTINKEQFAIVVSSKFPQEDSSIQRLKATLKEKEKMTLFHKNKILEKEVSDFI